MVLDKTQLLIIKNKQQQDNRECGTLWFGWILENPVVCGSMRYCIMSLFNLRIRRGSCLGA